MGVITRATTLTRKLTAIRSKRPLIQRRFALLATVAGDRSLTAYKGSARWPRSCSGTGRGVTRTLAMSRRPLRIMKTASSPFGQPIIRKLTRAAGPKPTPGMDGAGQPPR